MSKARARRAKPWPVGPNFAKSKSIDSTRATAIGSSIMASRRRASAARAFSVSKAVSETPVSATRCLAGLWALTATP
ncbi:Uncharacterised protein [Mycobacterium tuberculosis]|nr:Uncharacterised protein [Mycobacterium tuberculosis]COW68725.1 Uncharacterised protein [Mycobacterium tuberculosis]COW73643.1 Uncharacterised protein [Mycobacterium tuberculosis]